MRERATVTREFDPAEIHKGHVSEDLPSVSVAFLPLVTVVAVDLIMTALILPNADLGFLAEDRWGPTTPAGVSGVWSVMVALIVAILVLVAFNHRRLRDSVDAGLNASVLPVVSVASLVGFGSVVAALTGSASGGLTIALEALGATYIQLASELGIDPSLMHRVAVIGAGALDSLPHNGAVVTLLAVCGTTHRESYLDIVMVAIVGAIIALAAVIGLGTVFGNF